MKRGGPSKISLGKRFVVSSGIVAKRCGRGWRAGEALRWERLSRPPLPPKAPPIEALPDFGPHRGEALRAVQNLPGEALRRFERHCGEALWPGLAGRPAHFLPIPRGKRFLAPTQSFSWQRLPFGYVKRFARETRPGPFPNRPALFPGSAPVGKKQPVGAKRFPFPGSGARAGRTMAARLDF